MGTVPHWGTQDGADWWDTVILGGEFLPGIWSAEADVDYDLDVKKVKGKDGANYTDNGRNPAKVKITGQITSKEEWDEWQRIIPVVFPRTKGTKRDPLEITHPEPNSKGVFSVYTEGFPAMKLDKGIMAITVDAIEYDPAPKPTPKKGTGAMSKAAHDEEYARVKYETEAAAADLNQQLLDALSGNYG